ncbi:MAG: iron-containing alcohol dehydrogenase family protein [Clostridiales bacterium]
MNLTNRISIPAIMEVGFDKLANLGFYINKAGFDKIAIFFGSGIKELFGDTVLSSIKNIGNIEITKLYEFESNDISDIVENGFSIPPKTDLIIGIGGGRVVDVAKYISFLNDKPFFSVPTSTSNDGFSSSGSSLVINGKRTSVHAKMPYGIVVDIGVIKKSPVKFFYSGIGDLISKITALNDWKYEEENNKAIVNDFAAMISKKSIDSVLRLDFQSIYEDYFIKEFVDSLTLSGIAMEIAGSSAPASGSEHLISHALDKILSIPQLHGIQVGIATYLMSRVQEYRKERVEYFLKTTGFFNYVKNIEIKFDDFEKAIDIAPTIKPNRYTYLHNKKYNDMAKTILRSDKILKDILI